MIKQLSLLLLLGLSVAHRYHGTCDVEPPIVTTELGPIIGSFLRTRLGKSIYSFRGIRYAKPPVDELRFQPPVPVEPWSGVYNATEDGPSCPQPWIRPVSEDCLILNVYSTKLPVGPRNPKRPVIVFFHPGGFFSLTSTTPWTGPQYFMDQDIVFVTVNYRLGSLGFISTGDKEAPGNNGLRDQVVALKWVKNNIAVFGGDPDAVTISGYSAGSISVTLHTVSPMSQGLFHKAIAMSASGFLPRPYKTGQFDLAQRQAVLVGCPNDTSVNIINCLKTKSAEELGDSLQGFIEFGDEPILKWEPIVEEDYGQERFLTAQPIELVTSGQFAKVPVLIGSTSHELGSRAIYLIENATLREQLNEDFEKYAPIIFAYERNTENSKKISRGFKSFYFGDKGIDNSSIPSLAKMFIDFLGFRANRGAKLLAQYSDKPVYYYRFSYQGRYSHFYLPGTNDTVPYGVVHHDDLIYLWYISPLFPEFKRRDPESQMVDKLTTMWANFARTGNPIPRPTDKLDNVEWEPFNLESQKYMDIGKKLVISERLNEERYAEWERLFPLSQFTTRARRHA